MSGRGGTAAVLALVLAVAGCGEGVRAPEVQGEMPGRWSATPTSGTEISAAWVRAFGVSELDALVATADLDNLDVAAAAAKIAAAEAELAGTRAALGPVVTGEGGVGRTVTPGTRGAFSPPFRASVSDDYRLGLGASWQIDLNGRLRALAASREASLSAARIERDMVRLSTTTAIVDAWLRVAAARDRLVIARESIATAERTLAVYRRRLEVGTATALDVAQQQSLVASQRATVPDIEIELGQTRNSLVVLTGRAPEALAIRARGLSGVRVPTIGAGVPSTLLARRPDIAAAEASLTAAAADVEAARAAFLPEISLTGSTGLASAFLKNLLRPDAIASSAAAGLTAPILDSGARQADLDAARAAHEGLVATYRKTVHEALAEVENALIAVDRNRRHEILQQDVVRAARRAQKLTEERLAEGTIDVTTVLEAERTLFQAEQTLVAVRLARLRSVVTLAGALGGGWIKDTPAPTARREGKS